MSTAPTVTLRASADAGLRRREANLGEWQNEPYVQDVVVKMLVKAEYPLVLADFVATGFLPIASANRVLGRLHGRGFVTRQRLWMHRPVYCHRRKGCIPDGARRSVFAYSWIGG